MPYLFIAFVVVPIIEIGLFISIGGQIGLWPTLALVLLTAGLGSFLLAGQGSTVASSAMASV